MKSNFCESVPPVGKSNVPFDSFFALFTFLRYACRFRASEEKIRELRDYKLKSLISHAYQTVPYYRKLFRENHISPADIKSVEDLNIIPITKKSDLMEFGIENCISKKYINSPDLVRQSTSGSTGTPVNLIFRKAERMIMDMVRLRAEMMNGLRVNDKVALVGCGGTTMDMKMTGKWYERIGFFRVAPIPSNCTISTQASLLREYSPDIIFGFPSLLELIARHILENKICVSAPRLIFCSGEVLRESSFKIIKEAFDCEIFNFYGAAEVGNIAWECYKHQSLHINSDVLIVEVLNGKNEPCMNGQIGKCIVTSFISYTMPLIRYDLRDMVSMKTGKCNCGINFPLIKSIHGRDNDFITLENGKRIAPVQVFPIFLDKSIKQYQIIQEDVDQIVIKIVPTRNFSNIVKKLRSELCQLFGEKVYLEFHIVSSIDFESSGKFKSIISKVI